MNIRIVLYIFILTLIFSCKNKLPSSYDETYPTYFCNLEQLSEDRKFFSDAKFNNIEYSNGHLRSSEKSFSGKYSLKLNKNNRFGLKVKISDIKPGDNFKISVWRNCYNHNNEGLLVLSNKEKELYIQQENICNRDSSGWEQLMIKVIIPPSVQTNEIEVFVWQPGISDVYFDNLKIEKIKSKPIPELDSEAIRIFIGEPEYNKLIKIRKDAIDLGILEKNNDSWIKSMFFYKDDVLEVDMRLKGDWLDHLMSAKWSFRIKINKNDSWRGMREFSILNPRSRAFQYEWFGHKIMEKEEVLIPRYGFVPVYINNIYIGIFAFEEHFVKHLPESKNKREGPILKLSETGLWLNHKLHKNNSYKFYYPVFESSTILPYKLNKTLKDQNLNKQFLIAQNLLYQHKHCKIKVSEIFDINLAAKYFALIDLTKMYHGVAWHNQRFYYNPVTSKLEIVGYDGYPESNTPNASNSSLTGNFTTKAIKNKAPDSRMNLAFFSDSLFLENYVYYLKKYSDTLYLNNIFTELYEQINKFNKLLGDEYPGYQFDKNFYFENASKIKKDLPAYIKRIKSGVFYDINFKNAPKIVYNDKFNPKLPSEFVKVFIEEKQSDVFIYKVINYLSYGIEIIRIKDEGKKIFSSHSIDPIYAGAYNSKNNEILFRSEFQGNKLIFKVVGLDTVFSAPINPWNSPKSSSPRQRLINKSMFPLNDYYTISDKLIIFDNRKIKISRNIIIPKNYIVIIKAGTELDFVENSLFLSYSPVYILGKENNIVKIYTSDNTAKGFTVIQANKTSKIEYTEFDGINTLNYFGWTLTGAVNFYESDVSIKHTAFKNISCEDALNIIRSKFIVKNCKFENIFSDAFDSDFCTGKLSETTFNEIGNDAIDFSGSVVQISDCNIINAGDKGISGGENSTLIVKNCSVSDSKTGVASKDKSTVNLYNCTVQNCHYGLVAFQKKPEFGPAIIKAYNFKYSNLINFHLIEKESLLYLNDRKIFGYDKDTAKKFY